MQLPEILACVRDLSAAMERARTVLGERDSARLQRLALAEAVGGFAPQALSAAQMARIARRLEFEVAVEESTRSHDARPAPARHRAGGEGGRVHA